MNVWRDRALCQAFPAMPWIAEPERRSIAAERAMAAVCTACPVQLDCAAYVARHRICGGFWAGCDRSVIRRASGGAA